MESPTQSTMGSLPIAIPDNIANAPANQPPVHVTQQDMQNGWRGITAEQAAQAFASPAPAIQTQQIATHAITADRLAGYAPQPQPAGQQFVQNTAPDPRLAQQTWGAPVTLASLDSPDQGTPGQWSPPQAPQANQPPTPQRPGDTQAQPVPPPSNGQWAQPMPPAQPQIAQPQFPLQQVGQPQPQMPPQVAQPPAEPPAPPTTPAIDISSHPAVQQFMEANRKAEEWFASQQRQQAEQAEREAEATLESRISTASENARKFAESMSPEEGERYLLDFHAQLGAARAQHAAQKQIAAERAESDQIRAAYKELTYPAYARDQMAFHGINDATEEEIGRAVAFAMAAPTNPNAVHDYIDTVVKPMRAMQGSAAQQQLSQQAAAWMSGGFAAPLGGGMMPAQPVPAPGVLGTAPSERRSITLEEAAEYLRTG